MNNFCQTLLLSFAMLFCLEGCHFKWPAQVMETTEAVDPGAEIETVQSAEVVHHFWIFPFYPLFIMGGVLWWSFTIIVIFIFGCSIANDEAWWWGVLLVISYVLAMLTFSDTNPFAIVEFSWQNVLLFIGGYIFCGILYIMIRWVHYVKSNKRQFTYAVDEFLREHNLSRDPSGLVPSSHRKEFTKWFSNRNKSYDRNYIDVNPVANKHKNNFVTWGMWWFISLPVWLLKDYVREVWSYLVDAIAMLMAKISEYFWPDASGNFEKLDDPEGPNRWRDL